MTEEQKMEVYRKMIICEFRCCNGDLGRCVYIGQHLLGCKGCCFAEDKCAGHKLILSNMKITRIPYYYPCMWESSKCRTCDGWSKLERLNRHLGVIPDRCRECGCTDINNDLILNNYRENKEI